MLDKLKADFDGILELVNKAPAPLQELAFKMILEHWFAANAAPKPPPPSQSPAAPATLGVPEGVKPFLTANAITLEVLQGVYQPIGAGAQLLTSSIPGNSKARQLVNLAILLCVRQALESGNFTCSLKELRELAVHYNCYDSPNFSSTLSGNRNFNPRGKGADLELSGAGRKQAGDLIKSTGAAA